MPWGDRDEDAVQWIPLAVWRGRLSGRGNGRVRWRAQGRYRGSGRGLRGKYTVIAVLVIDNDCTVRM